MIEFNNDNSHFLKENGIYFGDGYFLGRLFNIGEYPGAVSSNLKNERVFGRVFKIGNPQKVFPILDEYEEIGKKYKFPNEFIRRKIKVYLNKGSEFDSWVYLYNKSLNGLEQIHSGNYFEYIKGFP